MMGLLDSMNDGIAVILDAPQLNMVAMLVSLQKRVGGLQARRDRIANTAQIDDTDVAHLTIKGNMRMPNDNDISLAAGQPLL